MKRNSSGTSAASAPAKKPKVDSNKSIHDLEADYWGITQIKLVTFNYMWTIDNYSFVNLETGKSLPSPTFLAANNQSKWQLLLYPGGKNEETKSYVAVFLTLASPDKIMAQYEFCIIDENGEEQNVCKCAPSLFTKSNGFGSNFILKSTLEQKPGSLLPNDRLNILCKMRISANDVRHLTEANAIQLKASKHTLSSDLEALFENKQFTDVELNVNGVTLHAHRIILASRSPVFCAMFQNDMKEKKERKIDISDVQPKVMKEVLRYLYTETVNGLSSMGKDIMAVADKYDLQGLKIMCEKALSDDFTIGNVIEILVYADIYNANHLKKQAMLFINKHSKELIDKPEFKALEKSHPHLPIQIFRSMLSKQKI